MDGAGTNDQAQDDMPRGSRRQLQLRQHSSRLYLKSERPRARPYAFVASIEFTDLQSETHFREQTSNLSLFGCHVDTGKLLPAGIRVRVRIVHRGASFVALGTVVLMTPSRTARVVPANCSATAGLPAID